jgi:Ca2+/H+ antiporter
MLAIGAVGLSLQTTIFAATDPEQGARATEYLSISEGIVLVVVYALDLVFYFGGRRATGEPRTSARRSARGFRWR